MVKKSILGMLLPALAAAVSCSPSTFNLGIEMRGPSRSGLSLGNKNLSVVYVDNGNYGDSLFLASVSEGFAQTLEKDYFGGNEVVGIYRVDKEDGMDYQSKKAMIRMLVETGSDATFLFDLGTMGKPTFSLPEKVASAVSADSAYLVEASTPFDIRLYAYDAMNVKDTVFVFNGRSTAKSPVYTSGDETDAAMAEKAMRSMDEPGYTVGRQSANIFLSTWDKANFTLYYYGSEEWYEASQAAYDYNWKKAMDIWMSMLGTKDLQKRSCLEYNLSVVNCILGQKSLAEQWLDRSDADYRLPESANLRIKIGKL
ncbi:MAG: hypothetical protein K2O58_02820 [Bacteroidales bacterium]|nr:hypothetical protein [Bacteroidales bacterium]MDE7126814.1 hypothetical protein [Bacteroidales bacterium]